MLITSRLILELYRFYGLNGFFVLLKLFQSLLGAILLEMLLGKYIIEM